MPLYEYVCHDCGTTEEHFRRLYERNEKMTCGLGHVMERIYSVPALSIWDADRSFPNAVRTGDGKFPTKAAYETHLKMNDMAETSTSGRNKSIIPRSMRK